MLYVVPIRDEAGRRRYALSDRASMGWPSLENGGAIAICINEKIANKLAQLCNESNELALSKGIKQ